jgi:hypothetical protein
MEAERPKTRLGMMTTQILIHPAPGTRRQVRLEVVLKTVIFVAGGMQLEPTLEIKDTVSTALSTLTRVIKVSWLERRAKCDRCDYQRERAFPDSYEDTIELLRGSWAAWCLQVPTTTTTATIICIQEGMN